LTDSITRSEALDLLRRMADGKAERERMLIADGYPAYTTHAGWLGYSDDKVARLAREAIADGFTHLKLKVGADLDDDVRRVKMVRELVGPDIVLSIDANQCWDVDTAIEAIGRLKPYDLAWVEEPTHPHDILGHRAIATAIAPTTVASGEHASNRVVFKQLLASNAIGVCQIDACRVAGVNENLGALLLAAKYGKPVCPHAGGIGLCEVVQHLAMFNFVSVSGRMDGHWIEHVPHLHEHFVEPVRVEKARYRAPLAPGSGAEMLASSVAEFSFPNGSAWSQPAAATD
jgi:L-fuconate dehydratase